MDKPTAEMHSDFLKKCQMGYGWQEFVAGYLSSIGFPSSVPKLTLRVDPSLDPFDDGEDVLCCGKYIEIKSSYLSFTSPDDFPFPAPMVDTVSSWAYKKNKPIAYICVSRKTKSMIFLPTDKTVAHWFKKRNSDRVKGYSDTFYKCDKKYWLPMSAFGMYMTEVLSDENRKLISENSERCFLCRCVREDYIVSGKITDETLPRHVKIAHVKKKGLLWLR